MGLPLIVHTIILEIIIIFTISEDIGIRGVEFRLLIIIFFKKPG